VCCLSQPGLPRELNPTKLNPSICMQQIICVSHKTTSIGVTQICCSDVEMVTENYNNKVRLYSPLFNYFMDRKVTPTFVFVYILMSINPAGCIHSLHASRRTANTPCSLDGGPALALLENDTLHQHLKQTWQAESLSSASFGPYNDHYAPLRVHRKRWCVCRKACRKVHVGTISTDVRWLVTIDTKQETR